MLEKIAVPNTDRNYPQANTPRPQPTFIQLTDALLKVLVVGHQAAERVEMATDRLIGAIPKDVSPQTAPPNPESMSLEMRMRELIASAEKLVNRIGETSDRLNSAV